MRGGKARKMTPTTVERLRDSEVINDFGGKACIR